MFIVYETTCLVNGIKYIGVHNRDDDGYLGSGNLIKKAIKKYGKKLFKREILFKFPTAEAAYEKENELITEDVVNSPNYYNLVVGGLGSSLTGIKNTKDFSKYSNASKERWKQPGYKEKACQSMRDNWNRTPERIHRLRTQNIGRTLSEAHKNKLHQAAIEKNSIVYDIHRGDEYIGSFTLKEFCARINGNLLSCRQGVWNRGAYKGYTFIVHNTLQHQGSL